jgi:hypothetical protein
MALYAKYETDKSFDYLEKIIEILEEPICILGGWAVYLTVNNKFKEDLGPDYLGSRDIDLGFHINHSLNEKELSESTMKKALNMLEKNGFKPQGFRYYKEIEYGTDKELSKEDAKRLPSHNIFTMYVDPIVDYVHPSFKKIFDFNPVDETFLTPVFKDKVKRKELIEFDKLLWLPAADVLLATKIKSAINRQKDEKYIKDLCDIYALSWYSDLKYNKIQSEVHKILEDSYFEKLHKRMNNDKSVFDKASIAMGIDSEIIRNLLENLCS